MHIENYECVAKLGRMTTTNMQVTNFSGASVKLQLIGCAAATDRWEQLELPYKFYSILSNAFYIAKRKSKVQSYKAY